MSALAFAVLSKKLRTVFPVIAVYWMITMGIIVKSLLLNDGNLVYPLDDTYIHMAIAKNSVEHGVWGITHYEFSSSTSAPLWTALLAAVYWVIGVNEWAPLFLNLIFGALCILTADSYLAGMFSNRFLYVGILTCVTLCVPLPGLTVIGMEHTLHAFLSLLFVIKLVAIIHTEDTLDRRKILFLGVLSALLPMSRYEGLFLIAIGIVMLILRKKPAIAAIIFVSSMVPVGGYGVWSMAHGWLALPNSLLLKSSLFSMVSKNIFSAVFVWMVRLAHSSHLLPVAIVLILSLIFLLRFNSTSLPILLMIILVLALLIVHMQCVGIHWLYRYEAYVVFMGLVTIISAAKSISNTNRVSLLMRKGIVLLFVCVLVFPMGKRAWGGIVRMPQAMNNIYSQQYQMGLFLHKHFRGATVAVNDIGAVNYFADVKIMDVWGLGSLAPALLKIEQRYREENIIKLLKEYGVQIAMVYDGVIPSCIGQKTAVWKIQNNVVCGSDTVAFYAIDPAACKNLYTSLISFSTVLPKGTQCYVVANACR